MPDGRGERTPRQRRAQRQLSVPPLIVLMGPTALGKTAIAVELAVALGGAIVTADSMQVYSGLPIITNQPTTEELCRVPHHLVGYVDPHGEYSAAAYAKAAHETIDRLRAEGTPVILEGGSGLYVRAALGGLSFGMPPAPELRAELERRLAVAGVAALFGELERRDPQIAARTDAANSRRVLRALETITLRQSDRPSPDGERDRLWLPGTRYPSVLFALEEERGVLRRRVDRRVPAQIAAGAVQEVATLLAGGAPSRTVAQAIGVRELSDHLAGGCSLDEAVAAMQARTWRFVRRQLTWMRKVPDTVRIRISGRPPAAVAEEIAGMLRSLS